MAGCVITRMEGPCATVILNRPERLNAMNLAMLTELDEAIDRLCADARCRTVVITGAGRAFVSGADISVLEGGSPDDARRFSKRSKEIFRKLELARPFTIAAINGYALGGGLELAMACDLRVASETAKMGITEAAIGSFPGSGGTIRLPRLVGLGRAKAMLATAEKITAGDALAWGLVEYVTSPEKLLPFCGELARRIACNSTEAIAMGKRLMTISAETDIERASELECAMIGLNYGSHDQQEGMRAFLEKRPPEFN